MKAATISYFIGGIGFVFMGLSIAFVSGISSAIVGVIILVVGAFLIRAGYQYYRNTKKQGKLNDWK
jgi:NhaP-type Na+/H+ or K+/H+ antiporter